MLTRRFSYALAVVLGSTMVMVSAQGFAVKAETVCTEPVGPEAALSAGVLAILASHSITTYHDEGGKSEAIHYQGLSDFRDRNRGCCTFTLLGDDDFAPTSEWSERNAFYGFVRVTFAAFWDENIVERRDENIVERRAVNVTRLVAITTCGKAIWYDVDDDDW